MRTALISVFLIAFILGSGDISNNAIALPSITKTQGTLSNLSKWKVSCSTDKFTDIEHCYSRYYLEHYSGNISGISFQIYDDGGASVLCISTKNSYPISYSESVIRVDKKKAIYFSGASVTGKDALKMFQQMVDGQAMLVRCQGDEFSIPLSGFTESYKNLALKIGIDPLGIVE